jgi:hypothetical protein
MIASTTKREQPCTGNEHQHNHGIRMGKAEGEERKDDDEKDKIFRLAV